MDRGAPPPPNTHTCPTHLFPLPYSPAPAHSDVISFAGDAIVAVWAINRDLPLSCALAASCAVQLQKDCGLHKIKDRPDLAFRIHIGLVCGTLESEILYVSQAKNMQTAFHYVSGAPLREVAACINTAKPGEICLTEAVRDMLGGIVTVVPTGTGGVYGLQALREPCSQFSPVGTRRHSTRRQCLAKLFVPPSVLHRFYNHNDLSQVWPGRWRT